MITLDDLFRIVAERGLRLSLGPDGQPILTGERVEATPALVRLLKLRKAEIVERLRDASRKPAPSIWHRREFLCNDGQTIYREPFPRNGKPYLVLAWRWEGEGPDEWRSVPDDWSDMGEW